ncbi:hypothetical protein ANO11243_002250 [Dothideomycetidae sp. 11243]|nr:hypothetical protein ANO11243_002250 [fungal sp. No.11243]
MGDEYQDYDDGVFFEDDYLYVEEGWAPADDLAETSVPSPPAIDTIEDHYVTYDPYDYWMDIEFGTDEYYDVLSPSTLPRLEKSVGVKRKLLHKASDQSANKRRKLAQDVEDVNRQGIWTGPNVVLIPSAEVYRLSEPCQACGNLKSYALLPDWKRIAYTTRIKSPSQIPGPSDISQEPDDEVESTSESPRDEALNPAQLMSILQKSLPGISPDGGTPNDLQQMLVQMMSNADGADMDQLLENLTRSVLDQVEEGGDDSDMTRWLIQQGVQIPEGDDTAQDGRSEEQEHSEQDAEQDKPLQRHDSSTDSATPKTHKRIKPSVLQTNENGDAEPIITEDAVSKSNSVDKAVNKGTKRKVGDDDGDHIPKKQARNTKPVSNGRTTRSSLKKR